ncbi:MAG: hypothetical protein SGILL_005580 [Bacillariaceae sp.]
MKLFASAFLVCAALVQPIFGQTLFTVDTATVTDPAGSWAIDNGQTTTVAISFDLVGESSNSFSTTATDCGSGYTFGTTGGVTDLEVTFTNTAAIVDAGTTFCVSVSLLFNSVEIHEKTFTWTVTANENGDVSVTPDTLVAISVADAGSADQDASEDLTRADPSVQVGLPNGASNPVFGLTTTIVAVGNPNYFLRIASVTGDADALDNFAQGTISAGQADASFDIPFSYFENGATISLTVAVDWDVNGFRRLRQLQDGGDEVPPSGQAEYDVTLTLDTSSIEGISAGGYKVTSMVGRCVAAAGAVAATAAAVI